jgi:hypothetical protein
LSGSRNRIGDVDYDHPVRVAELLDRNPSHYRLRLAGRDRLLS